LYANGGHGAEKFSKTIDARAMKVIQVALIIEATTVDGRASRQALPENNSLPAPSEAFKNCSRICAVRALTGQSRRRFRLEGGIE
jgi:hypothetical protein